MVETAVVPSKGRRIVRINYRGRVIRIPVVANCHLCHHPNRIIIEEGLLRGQSPKSITRSPISVEGLSAKGIASHRDLGHIALPTESIFRTMLERAEDQGMSVEQYEAMQGSEYVALELTVNKFRQRLMDEDFLPDFGEGLSAIKLLNDLKRGVTNNAFSPGDLYAALAQFRAHVNAVIIRYVPNDAQAVMRSLDTLLDNDPILSAMSIKSSSGATEEYVMEDEVDDDEVVDAEIVYVSPEAPDLSDDGGFNDDFDPALD